ncbi:CSC1 protein [Trifolium repens]|nr:CSC1 protein [Trifolium repens]
MDVIWRWRKRKWKGRRQKSVCSPEKRKNQKSSFNKRKPAFTKTHTLVQQQKNCSYFKLVDLFRFQFQLSDYDYNLSTPIPIQIDLRKFNILNQKLHLISIPAKDFHRLRMARESSLTLFAVWHSTGREISSHCGADAAQFRFIEGNVAATQYGTGVISTCFSNDKVRVGDMVMKNYAISGLFRHPQMRGRIELLSRT